MGRSSADLFSVANGGQHRYGLDSLVPGIEAKTMDVARIRGAGMRYVFVNHDSQGRTKVALSPSIESMLQKGCMFCKISKDPFCYYVHSNAAYAAYVITPSGAVSRLYTVENDNTLSQVEYLDINKAFRDLIDSEVMDKMIDQKLPGVQDEFQGRLEVDSAAYFMTVLRPYGNVMAMNITRPIARSNLFDPLVFVELWSDEDSLIHFLSNATFSTGSELVSRLDKGYNRSNYGLDQVIDKDVFLKAVFSFVNRNYGVFDLDLNSRPKRELFGRISTSVYELTRSSIGPSQEISLRSAWSLFRSMVYTFCVRNYFIPKKYMNDLYIVKAARKNPSGAFVGVISNKNSLETCYRLGIPPCNCKGTEEAWLASDNVRLAETEHPVQDPLLDVLDLDDGLSLIFRLGMFNDTDYDLIAKIDGEDTAQTIRQYILGG